MTADAQSLIGSDLVLLMLAAPGQGKSASGRVDGVTRLEKLLYLASRESDLPARVEEPLRFVPYNFGPFSKGVYEAVELLEEMQPPLVREVRVADGETIDNETEAGLGTGRTEYVERRFLLTDEGRLVADLLARQHPEAMKLMAAIKGRYGGLTLNQLVNYVYNRYPEDTVNSLIRDRHLPPSRG
jgi:hypothetical protein